MGVGTKDARSLSAQAVTDMNGKEVSGRLLYVGRAQKRVERQNELKRRFEQMKQDRLTRYQVRVRPLVTAAARGECLCVAGPEYEAFLQQSHPREAGFGVVGGCSFQGWAR